MKNNNLYQELQNLKIQQQKLYNKILELEYKIKYEKIEIASVNIPIEYINVKTKQKEYSMNPAVQQIQEMLQKDVEEAEKKHKKWLGIF
jgi:hypothetical protein